MSTMRAILALVASLSITQLSMVAGLMIVTLIQMILTLSQCKEADLERSIRPG